MEINAATILLNPAPSLNGNQCGDHIAKPSTRPEWKLEHPTDYQIQRQALAW